LIGEFPLIAPDKDEIEVSIFGPGYGECVLLHVGNNSWIQVDSCIDSNTNHSASLQYLNKIKVKAQDAIQTIIASHWHDDHIRGLSEITNLAKNAEFWCSMALNRKEFLTLVCAYQDAGINDNGITEFSKILNILKTRKAERKDCLKRAKANCIIREDRIQNKDKKYKIFIKSLTPMDGAITKAFNEISSCLPEEYIPKRRIISQRPNQTAVVLLVQIHKTVILLGSDLEERANKENGWTAIVDSNIWNNKKSSVFKIPHHGSISAHCEEVWQKMLTPSPISLLTSYNNAGQILPTTDDIERICGKTKRAYIAGLPKIYKSPKRPKSVEKTIKETVKKIHMTNGQLGQIRLRKKINRGEWRIDLDGDSSILNQQFFQ